MIEMKIMMKMKIMIKMTINMKFFLDIKRCFKRMRCDCKLQYFLFVLRQSLVHDSFITLYMLHTTS